MQQYWKMMNTLSKLQANWGDKADSYDCYAWMRLYDPESRWECYVYAIDPLNEQGAKVCVYNGTWVFSQVNLDEMMVSFVCENGRAPRHDLDFKGKHLKNILKGYQPEVIDGC